MSPSNLTAVYNNNPTLQSMYSLPDYLALFGQDSSSTPQLATAYVDPTTSTTSAPASTGIPSIINQNLNQGGGGEGDGPQGIADTPGTYGKEYTGQTMPDGTPIGSMVEMEGPGIIDSLKNTTDDLVDFYKTYSPFGFILGKIEQTKKDKIAREKIAFEKAEKERIAKEAIAEAERIEAAKKEQERQAIANLAGLSSTTTQGGGGGIASSGMTGAQAAGMGGGSRQATSAGSTKSGRTDGGWGWAKGGFVRGSYFNGGIVSLRRR